MHDIKLWHISEWSCTYFLAARLDGFLRNQLHGDISQVKKEPDRLRRIHFENRGQTYNFIHFTLQQIF